MLTSHKNTQPQPMGGGGLKCFPPEHILLEFKYFCLVNICPHGFFFGVGGVKRSRRMIGLQQYEDDGITAM